MLRKLIATPNRVTAQLIGLYLNDCGVETFGPQESPLAFLAGGDTAYFLEVEESEVERAIVLLEAESYEKWILR